MTVTATKGQDLFIIPLSYMIALQIGGDMTGGHFNPAVTTAIVVGKRKYKDLGRVLFTYWTAQCLGGIVGFMISRALLGNSV